MTRTAKLLLLPVLALVLALTGCTSDEGVGTAGSSTDGTSQLDKVLERGTLRVAVLPDFPPWSVQSASGEFEGYEVDIAKALADAMGVELELVSTDGTSRLPLLNADRVDLNISAWTATDERALAVGYTIPYAAAGASVLYSSDNPISSYDQLSGKRVAVARGSTNDLIMTEDFPDTEVVRFETIADAVAALKAGKVDATVEGEATVTAEADKSSELEKVDAPPLKPSLISMGVLPGDQVWLNYLNNFIRNLNSSGTNDELHRKWLGIPLSDVIAYAPDTP
ncbi:MAG: transporter substrate-binding domain-containing protein [Pseudonocardiaceae bacterium]